MAIVDVRNFSHYSMKRITIDIEAMLVENEINYSNMGARSISAKEMPSIYIHFETEEEAVRAVQLINESA